MSILQSLQRHAEEKVPVYFQSEVAECGHACLAMVASYYGHHLSVAEARAAFPPSLRGANLTQLMEMAKALKLTPKAVKLDLPALKDLPLPAVLHWDFTHFVVLVKAGDEGVRIHDPALGERTMPLAEFSKHFTGVALQLKPDDDFQAKAKAPQLRIRDLLGKVRSFKTAAVQVLLFALLLELFGLALPLMGQVVADEVLPNADASLLTVLGLGFLGLVAMRSVLAYLRDRTLTMVTIGLKAQVAERVYRHALRLPPEYFERRRAADVSSRFDSLAAIERTLAGNLVTALLDGAFASIIALLLFTYSLTLGLIVTVGALAYAAIRLALFRPMRELEMRVVEAYAKQQASLLETLRAIVPVQLANKSGWRMAQWGTHLSTGANASLRLARINALLSATRTAVVGCTAVAFTWVGASLVLDDALSIGALLAVLAYQQTASGRLISFIENVLAIRLLGVHLERLSDIVYAQPMPQAAQPSAPDGGEPLSLSLKDVRFRYSPSDPEILKGVTLEVRAGEHVALAGPSGCGKTTLLKLMLGILQPTSGQVLVNGKPLDEFGQERLRAMSGAVLQDDLLFFGTIKDNISFFDPEATDEEVARCAALAGIHPEIMTLSANYLTLVGEGSGALSGGQRQRVLLARAIYRQPRMLMLDEATSHLDLRNEAVINAGIATLKATRVSIAHRPESLLAAERVVVLQGGAVAQELQREQFAAMLRGPRPEPPKS